MSDRSKIFTVAAVTVTVVVAMFVLISWSKIFAWIFASLGVCWVALAISTVVAREFGWKWRK